MSRTLLVEHFRIKGRGWWYEFDETIHANLDVFVAFYNLKHNHQYCRLKGRTPAQALREAIGRKSLPPIIPKGGKNAIPDAA